MAEVLIQHILNDKRQFLALTGRQGHGAKNVHYRQVEWLSVVVREYVTYNTYTACVSLQM